MAREKKLQFGAINVTMQPHTPQKYIDLFKAVNKLGSAVHIAGDQYGLLAGVFKVDTGKKYPCPINGDIYRFTNINKNSQWFNTLTNGFATDNEVDGVVIPEYLKPNSTRFSYIFYPEQHLVFYESYFDGNCMGPSKATKFFQNLFSQEVIVKKFGKIEVTHIPDKSELEQALSIPIKEKISFKLTVPNSDSLAKAERLFMKRMNKMNAETFDASYKAKRGLSIELDEDLTQMAYISAKNGSCSIKGRGHDARPVEYTTAKHPFQHTQYYDPDIESAYESFLREATSLKDEVLKWFRK